MKKIYQHIDLNYLHAIADGDQAFTAEMLNNFKATIPKYLAALAQAIQKQQIEEAKFYIHKLKSSVQMAGTLQILNVLNEVELTIQNSGFTDILPEKNYTLLSLYEQALIELDVELKTLSA